MYLLIIYAQIIYSCSVVIRGYENFPEGSNVTCYGGEDKSADFMIVNSDPQTGDFNIHNPIKCYFNNQNCKDDIYITGLNQNSCPSYGKYVDIDSSEIPVKCFHSGYLVVIRNGLSYPGYEIYVKDKFDNTEYTVHYDELFYIEHDAEFTVEVYFKADRCNLNKLVETLKASKNAETKHYDYTLTDQYCKPVRFTLVKDLPNDYQLYFKEIDEEFYEIYSERLFVTGIQNYYNIYVRLTFGDYCNELTEIETTFIGTEDGVTYHITEDDVPQQCLKYNLHIYNNIQKEGYTLYGLINGIGDYFEITNGDHQYTEKTRFYIEIYIKWEECQEYVYIKTISSSFGHGDTIYIQEDDIPTECSKYNIYNLNITNDILIPGYELYVYDDVVNYDQLIQNNGNITIFHREPFIANVSIKMDSCNPGYQIDSIKVSSDPISKVYNLDNIPNQCSPYRICFNNKIPDSYSLYYKINTESNQGYQQLTNDPIISGNNFGLSLYVTSKVGCDKQQLDKTFESSKETTCIELTLNDIPTKCQINDYYVCIDITELPNNCTVFYSIDDDDELINIDKFINISNINEFQVNIYLTYGSCVKSLINTYNAKTNYECIKLTNKIIPSQCNVNGGIGDDIEIPENQYHELEIAGSSVEEVKSQLNDAFNDEKNWGSGSNNDKVIKITNQNSPLEFNMELDDKQYINFPNGIVKYEGGNLNLVLSNNEKTEVQLANSNAKVSVKGGGNLELNSEKDEVNINSVLTLTEDFSLAAKGNLKTINIKTINLYENSNLNIDPSSTVTVNVNKVEVKPMVETTLENINIVDTLIITETASVSLDSTIIQNANLIFNIKSNSDIMPMLDGKLLETPKTFSITNDGGKPKENQQITLITGDSESFDCGKWRDLLSLEGSGYNTKECIDFSIDDEDKVKKLEENEVNKALIIKNNKKDKGGTKPGVIATIVIVVVVVVAAVIAIVIFVIRKKKNKNKSESEDQAIEDNI